MVAPAVWWYGQHRVCLPWVQIRDCSEDVQCNTGEHSHKPFRLLCAWFLINFCLPHVQSPFNTNQFFETPVFSYMIPIWGVAVTKLKGAGDLMSTLISDMEMHTLPYWFLFFTLVQKFTMFLFFPCFLILILQKVTVKRSPWLTEETWDFINSVETVIEYRDFKVGLNAKTCIAISLWGPG